MSLFGRLLLGKGQGHAVTELMSIPGLSTSLQFTRQEYILGVSETNFVDGVLAL